MCYIIRPLNNTIEIMVWNLHLQDVGTEVRKVMYLSQRHTTNKCQNQKSGLSYSKAGDLSVLSFSIGG